MTFSDYKVLLSEFKRCIVKLHRLRILAPECFCCINSMNPYYIENPYDKNTRSKRRPNGLIIPFYNTATLGDKNIKLVD